MANTETAAAMSDRLEALKKAQATRPVSDQPQHVSDDSTMQTPSTVEYNHGQVLMRIPDFVRQQADLTALLRKINEQINTASRLNRRALKTVEGQGQSEAISECRAMTDLIRLQMNRATNILQDIEQDNDALASRKSEAAASFALRVTKTASLRKSLSQTVKHFYKVQQDNQQLLTDDLRRQYLLVNPKATPLQIQSFLQDEPGARKHLFAEAVKCSARQECAMMEARCRDMQALQQSIVELSQLYQQLDLLVDQQQHMLDSVESRMQAIDEDTEQGREAMKESVQILQRRQKRKLIIIVVVVVVVLIILVGILAKVAPLLLLMRPNQVSIVNNNPSLRRRK